MTTTIMATTKTMPVALLPHDRYVHNEGHLNNRTGGDISMSCPLRNSPMFRIRQKLLSAYYSRTSTTKAWTRQEDMLAAAEALKLCTWARWVDCACEHTRLCIRALEIVHLGTSMDLLRRCLCHAFFF